MAGTDTTRSSVAVVMAGGSGTRFWPLSTKSQPKQYLTLLGERSLIQETVQRILPLIPEKNVYVCSAASQEQILGEQVPHLSQNRHFILEPRGKNTAPCLMLSTLHLLKIGFPPETPMVVLPADHHIENVEEFRKCLTLAIDFAISSKGLVTLGVIPTSPHTGYGYIEVGDGLQINRPVPPVLKVKRFIEKPDKDTANVLIKNPANFWNSGMFVWTLEAIGKAFELYLPESWKNLKDCANENDLAKIYDELSSVSIDVGVLEKADNIYLIPAAFGWSDVGTWDALFQLRKTPSDKNVVVSGEVHCIDSSGCLVATTTGKKVALVGVDDLIVVEKGDTLLITHRSADQKVREACKHFEET